MIRSLILKILKQKNPDFEFDPAVSSRVLISLSWTKMICHFRSYKLFFLGNFPRKMFVGKGVQFFNVANMEFGKFVQLEDHVYLNALGKQSLKLGDNVKIGAFSRLIISTSFNHVGNFIRIGDNVGLGEFAYLGGAGGLEIGADCIIGQYLSCHPENHNFENPKQLIRHQGTTRQGIKIGKNCWIGAKVTILDGVQIGENCVIAAGAVVNKSMPANSVIGGVPARVLKKNVQKEKEYAHV